MASGPAIKSRWGLPAEELPENHPAWLDEAGYLAEGIANIILVISPEIVVLGGGVMQQDFLFPMIQEIVQRQLNSYIQRSEIIDQIENYIVPAMLGKQAGLLGAIALAIKTGE